MKHASLAPAIFKERTSQWQEHEFYRSAVVLGLDIGLDERGRHGIGLGSQPYGGGERHPWTRDCAFWLKERGFAK